MANKKRFTQYDLKYYYELNNPDGHFFSRNNMKFQGDTMRNFGVRGPYEVTDRHGEKLTVYELYRRNAVRFMGFNVGKGVCSYFDAVTFKEVHSIDKE